MSTPLSKFGVPLDGGQRKVMSQPKLQHKFRVMLNNFGTTSSDGNNVCFDADTVSRPNVTFDVTALRKFGVPSYYVQGHKYDTIKLVIRDVVSNDSVRGICRQIQKQLDVHRRISTFSAQNYANYHFKMIIETLGGANPDDTMGNFIRDTSSDVIGSLLGNTAANYLNDANNCNISGVVSIIQPSALSISINTQSASCSTPGSATASVTGGVG